MGFRLGGFGPKHFKIELPGTSQHGEKDGETRRAEDSLIQE